MSLPWLEDDFKESSKSRSRSPLVKEEAKVDKPVDPVPQKSPPRKSRSRSQNYRKRRDRSSRHSYDSSHSRESRKQRGHSPRHSRRKRRGSSSSSSGSGSSYSSSSSSSSSGSVPTRIIASRKKKYVKARLYVTNVDSKEISKDDLVRHFKKYGAVIDCLLHGKNYAFIQFAKQEDALLAIEGERDRTLRGRELVVTLASERRSKMKDAKEKENAFQVRSEPPERSKRQRPRQGEHVDSRRGGHVDSWRGGHVDSRRGGHVDSWRGGHVDSRRGGHVDTVDRRQSPPRGGPFPPHREEPYPPHREEPYPPHREEPYPPHREEPYPPHHEEPYPPHREEPYPPHGGPFPPPRGGRFPPPHSRGSFPPRHRGPGPDSFRGRPRPPYGPGPGRFGGMRPPFFEDPYGPPGPWVEDEPFRPPRFEEPFRDTFGSHPPAECEIFVKNSSLRPYGEYVEGQIKKFSIVTSVSNRPHHISPIQLLEDLRAQKVLFAIFISDQNEEHKSLTLNVLHGSPQEHRNMPVDDAVNFILDSFHKYVEGLKAKADAHGGGALPPLEKASATFLQAPPDVAYLVHLLADNRSLTVEELDSIIHYLTQRRDSLVDPKSRKLVAEEDYRKTSKSGHDSPAKSPDSHRRSQESHHRSPESHRRSQESHRRSQEGHRRSPESHRRSPESHRRSPESHRRSPESHRRSPESHRRSPESHRRSPESHRRFPESRDRSLEIKRRSLEEGPRRSLEEGHRRSPLSYRRSPESHRRSPGSYRKPSPMDLDAVSQSPKAESSAATQQPVLLTDDLKSKIINILNNVRIAQNAPTADGAQQPSKFPASASTAAAPPAHAAPPLPPPPALPPLPPNEFNNFTSSGVQGSGDSMFMNSNSMNSGFLNNVKGGSSMPGTSQPMGDSTFPSDFEAGNQYNQNSGDWWMGFKDVDGYGSEARQEQGAQDPAGGSYQGPYSYPGMHNQMGNYGPRRY